jgi:hypothetical protein
MYKQTNLKTFYGCLHTISSVRSFVICATLFVTLLFSAQATQSTQQNNQVVRPSIWVKPADRIGIIRKINTQDWARSLYMQLGRRAALVASDDIKKRRANIESMPLLWLNGKSNPPVLPVFRVKGGGNRDQQNALVKSLHDGVDCGVMYFLTEEEKYAKCGADVLFTVINALKQMPLSDSKKQNAGWMYPEDHLYESRVIGAQLPVIYDFVYNYLKAKGKVYSIASDDLVAFNFDDAQAVFTQYIDLALNRGLYDSNWPVLESSSLVHNILALNDPALIEQYLPYYTHVDTKRQASLKKVSENFANEGDIWPESFGYSKHVASFSVYLMTLLDRYDPQLALGKKHPNISAAFASYYDLQFPNEEYPFLGDGHRQYDVDYHSMEKAYLLSLMNGNSKQQKFFGDYLSSSIKNGDYNRGQLKKRSFYPSPYYTPTQLLWFNSTLDSSGSVDIKRPRPRTKRLEFAGINIQRNISDNQPIKNSLMSFIGGGSYIHGHASGIDMELYGQGHVLGITAGKSTYRSDVHENYYRIFASHNTVISNGASASKGGWINLGIDRVQQEISEPALGEQGVSDNYSVTRSSFNDRYNLVAAAEHQRTLALIRLSDSKGYYLDIFQAKSGFEEEFHDYIYRNIGDKLQIFVNGKKAEMKKDSKRYAASADLPWEVQRKYRHPGWHFFDDVRSSNLIDEPLQSEFTAKKLGKKDIVMKVFMPGGFTQQITTANSPKAHGVPKAYKDKKVPVMVLRRQGEAWNRPFVAAFESTTEGEAFAIQHTELLIDNGQFKGVKVALNVDGRKLTQYIISQNKFDDVYQNAALSLYFKGQFAIVTFNEEQKLVDMYIGSGSELNVQQQALKPSSGSKSAFKKL